MLKREQAKWNCRSRIKKYHEIFLPEEESKYKPYEIIEMEGNALIQAGVDILWTLACGGAATNYGSANAVLAVYITDTWVSGALTGGYPTYGSTGKATWKASWAGATGDGPWSKWRVTNGTQALNEKDEAMGTKSGGTWTLEVDITLS